MRETAGSLGCQVGTKGDFTTEGAEDAELEKRSGLRRIVLAAHRQKWLCHDWLRARVCGLGSSEAVWRIGICGNLCASWRRKGS